MNKTSIWLTEPLKTFISTMGDGGTPSRDEESNFNGDIPWVVINDIQRNIFKTKENISTKGLASSNAKLWPKNSIILSTGATIGKVGIAQVPLATKQGITGLVPNEKINPKFLYYELNFNKEKIIAWAQGSTFAEIRIPVLGKIPLTVPKSLVLQQKIARILETIDHAIEKNEALIEKYQQIKAGLMHDLFTRGIGADGKLRPPREEAPELYQETPIGWIPKDWSHTAFVESIELLTDYHANGAYEILKDHVELLDYPDFAVMIRTTNFEQNDFDNDVKYITRKAFSFLSKSVVYPSDILMNKIANPGVSYLMPDLGVPVSLGMNLFLIRLKEGISPKFIHEYLCFKEEYVKSFSNGTGTKTITKDAVRSLIISMPNSPDEITLISDTLACMSEKIAKEKTYLKSLNNQKSGLMHDLLTGKVQLSINNSEEAHV